MRAGSWILHTLLASRLRKVVPPQPQEPHFFQYIQPTFSLSFLICKMCLVKGGYSLSASELAEHMRLNIQMFDARCTLSGGADMGRAG